MIVIAGIVLWCLIGSVSLIVYTLKEDGFPDPAEFLALLGIGGIGGPFWLLYLILYIICEKK